MSKSNGSRRSETIRRRLRTIPTVSLAWVVVTLLLPVLLVLALTVDAGRWVIARSPWMAVRLVSFLWVYLTSQVAAILGLGLVWLVPGRRVAWTYVLQGLWVSGLFHAVTGIFGVRFAVAGTDLVEPGPILVFARHASIVDNLLPHRLVTRPSGIRLRYVLKHELLSDPALDIAGLRLPNVFVRRGSRQATQQIEQVGALAEGLDSGSGVLIFPEGTRFRASKQPAAIATAVRRNPEIRELAEGLTSVSPPRLGGPLALLDRSNADVVVLAHRGLGGFATVADIWSGAMVGRHLDVRLTRIPRDAIPVDEAGRVRWLFELWAELDRWVGESAPPAD